MFVHTADISSGEYDDDYKDVVNSPKISTYPKSDPTRWTMLLDAILLGNNDTVIPLNTSVSGAPSDKAVVMLDSGTSYTSVDPYFLLLEIPALDTISLSYAPKSVCDAIYGSIQGATYSAALGQWIIPCDAEVDVALQFG